MSRESSFKVEYVPWWRPVPLAVKKLDANGRMESFDFVGYVWRQKAYLVKNLNHGWIAFVDEQDENHLNTCPCCGKLRGKP